MLVVWLVGYPLIASFFFFFCKKLLLLSSPIIKSDTEYFAFDSLFLSRIVRDISSQLKKKVVRRKLKAVCHVMALSTLSLSDV